jgi:hypothetical protein
MIFSASTAQVDQAQGMAAQVHEPVLHPVHLPSGHTQTDLA